MPSIGLLGQGQKKKRNLRALRKGEKKKKI